MGNSSSKDNSPASIQPPSDQPISTPISQSKQISPRVHNLTQQLISSLQKQQYKQLEQHLNNLTYKIPTNAFPLCLNHRPRNQMYFCKDCFRDQNIFVCATCFQKEDHQGHNYGTQEGRMRQFCVCGNGQVRKTALTCKNHQESKAMQSEQQMDLLKKQVRFLLSLFMSIRNDNASTYHITPVNLSILAQSFLKYLNSLCKDNNSVTKIVTQLLLQSYLGPEKDKIRVQRTALELLIQYVEGKQHYLFIRELLIYLAHSGTHKEALIKVFFNYLLDSRQFTNEITELFSYTALPQAKIFPQSYHKYFTIPENCNQNRAFANLSRTKAFVSIKYTTLSKIYFSILQIENCHEIWINILEKTGIHNFLDFQKHYVAFQSYQYSQIELKGVVFANIMAQMVRKVKAKSKQGSNYLSKWACQLFTSILDRKTNTFNRIFQRTFALILFQLYPQQLPNRLQLSQLLSTQLSFEQIQHLIFEHIQFKTQNQHQYKEIILQHANNSNQLFYSQFSPMMIVAIDDYYLKSLCNLLKNHQIEMLYHNFLKDVAEELNQKKIRHIIKVISLVVSTNMPELVLKANADPTSKQACIILKNLLFVLDGTSAARFKENAQRFIQKEEIIVNFIKKEAVIDNKKIKCKTQELTQVISLPLDSQFILKMHLEQNQKLLQNYRKAEKPQCCMRFFNEKTLAQVISLWQKFIEVTTKTQFQHSKHQKEIIDTLQILCHLYILNQAPAVLKMIQTIHKKVQLLNPKLQAYQKAVFDKAMVEEKDVKKESMSDKKKKKMMEMREKQKNAMKNFKIQKDNNIDLECIFCKNSVQGQPYLLSHFKYNNFYSKRILQMDAPFMQFTTCGHSAHEKCLIQMHKGQFRVWYPCILCKSITNMLLPWNSDKLSDQKRFQKVLDFLKNFASTYTFFFQDKKQLTQFSVNDVSGCYRLLFKTIIYQLTIYPIVNYSYFIRNQYPILKFIFDLLKFTHKKVKTQLFSVNYELKVQNQLTDIFYYNRYQLEFLIVDNLSNMALQRKIDEYRDKFPEGLTVMYDEIYQNLTDEKKTFECELKDTHHRDLIKGTIYKPPTDLFQLRNLKKKCQSCESVTQNFQICLLCQWSCCLSCSAVRKVHSVQSHIGETVFINGYTGQYSYLHDQLEGSFNSIYIDYLGNEAKKKTNIKQGEFTLDENSWGKIINDIVCNRLHKEVMRQKA